MAGGDISIDFGGALPYVVDRVSSFFGKDAETENWRTRLKNHISETTHAARFVQCVGMHKPLPVGQIYHPPRINQPDGKNVHPITIADLLNTSTLPPRGEDGELLITPKPKDWKEEEHARLEALRRGAMVAFAGPGRGKSMLLKTIYLQALQGQKWAPLLFPVRSAEAIEILFELVDRIGNTKTLALKSAKHKPLLLLVDGYDEISEDAKTKLGSALSRFQATLVGRLILTCRTFVPVRDILAFNYYLEDFAREDAEGFINDFSAAYGHPVNGEAVYEELTTRGFRDFTESPLLLTFICVLKSGPDSAIPRNAIALLRRAIEVLTFRWDYERGIARKSIADGHTHERCMMRIAYLMSSLEAPQEEVEHIIAQHLSMSQWINISPRELLSEMARFYGLLIPNELGMWHFVHKSVHNFLAARYWVEEENFAPPKVKEWNTRAAYAACLRSNATQFMVYALHHAPDMHAFIECLYNHADFEVNQVADALIERIEHHNVAYLRTNQAFLRLSSNGFLDALVKAGRKRASDGTKALTALAADERATRAT